MSTKQWYFPLQSKCVFSPSRLVGILRIQKIDRNLHDTDRDDEGIGGGIGDHNGILDGEGIGHGGDGGVGDCEGIGEGVNNGGGGDDDGVCDLITTTM